MEEGEAAEDEHLAGAAVSARGITALEDRPDLAGVVEAAVVVE